MNIFDLYQSIVLYGYLSEGSVALPAVIGFHGHPIISFGFGSEISH